MTTISIKEDTRKELLRIVSEIQKRSRERVDFDTVVRFLIDVYWKKSDLKAWRRFASPIAGVDFDTLYSDLMMERHLDERGRRCSDCT